MYIANNSKVALSADVPELPEVATVKSDNPSFEALRIEVVVKYEFDYPTPPTGAATKQERTAFTSI
jgi:hypothetical protein